VVVSALFMIVKLWATERDSAAGELETRMLAAVDLLEHGLRAQGRA